MATARVSRWDQPAPVPQPAAQIHPDRLAQWDPPAQADRGWGRQPAQPAPAADQGLDRWQPAQQQQQQQQQTPDRRAWRHQQPNPRQQDIARPPPQPAAPTGPSFLTQLSTAITSELRVMRSYFHIPLRKPAPPIRTVALNRMKINVIVLTGIVVVWYLGVWDAVWDLVGGILPSWTWFIIAFSKLAVPSLLIYNLSESIYSTQHPPPLPPAPPSVPRSARTTPRRLSPTNRRLSGDPTGQSKEKPLVTNLSPFASPAEKPKSSPAAARTTSSPLASTVFPLPSSNSALTASLLASSIAASPPNPNPYEDPIILNRMLYHERPSPESPLARLLADKVKRAKEAYEDSPTARIQANRAHKAKVLARGDGRPDQRRSDLEDHEWEFEQTEAKLLDPERKDSPTRAFMARTPLPKARALNVTDRLLDEIDEEFSDEDAEDNERRRRRQARDDAYYDRDYYGDRR